MPLQEALRSLALGCCFGVRVQYTQFVNPREDSGILQGAGTQGPDARIGKPSKRQVWQAIYI